MLIKQIKNNITFLLFVIILLGCKKKETIKPKIIAEVGNVKLTEKQLNNYLKEKNYSFEFKDEFIRQWIETELLYQIAEQKGLLKSTYFNNITKQSEKQLAASMVIKEFLNKTNLEYNEAQLLKFYNKNRNDFILHTDAYILNYISFTNEEDAINFRKKALLKNWNEAEKEIKNKNSVLENYKNKLIKISQIPSKKILRILNEQLKNEISLVIKTELNKFVVVQQKEKIGRNSVPEFNYIKKDVEILYKAFRNRELIHNYINKLISEKHVKIIKENK